MVSRLRLFWRQIREHWVIVIIAAPVVVIALIVTGYILNWGWTGLSKKTLWDWLQLAIIPLVLTFGVWWLTRLQQQRDQQLTDQRAKSEQEAAEKRAQTEREISLDNQREAALQAYIDKMSELLLTKGLRESKPDDEVRKIARLRTITVLTQLDVRRVGYVFAFLREAGLNSATSSDNVVSFDHADLRTVNWSQAYLTEANLSRAYLYKADLSGATDLVRADLSGAGLRGANLDVAILGGADLSGADLYGANLDGAYLDGANLSKAILVKAILRGAKLYEANLSGADLSGADLSYANLYGAKITEAQLKAPKSLEGTTMPTGPAGLTEL